MKSDQPTQIRLRWMGAGVAVVALVSVLWWWAGAGGVVVLLALAVCARASVRLSRAGQRQQGQEDLLARRFRNVLAPESSCPMPPYYDGWNLIEERDSTGAVVASYVHGANVDEMLTMTRGGQTYYYHHDALGSVTHLSDATGALVEKYSYDVFGQPAIFDPNNVPRAASIAGNRFLFTGREYLAALGLYDYRHRIYMPMIGRFLQTDPIRFDAGDVNLYRYVQNQPTVYRDPLGLTGTCTDDAQRKCCCQEMTEVEFRINDSNPVGHGFLWTKEWSAGFQPPKKLKPFVRGHTEDESFYPYEPHRTIRFNVCPETLEILMSSADTHKNDFYNPFNIFGSSCFGWALNRLGDAGLPVHSLGNLPFLNWGMFNRDDQGPPDYGVLF